MSNPTDVHPRKAVLAAAINETIGFLFAIRQSDSSLGFPEIRIAPLLASGARIDDSAVELFRVHPVPLHRLPGWHVRTIDPSRRQFAPLDVLVPLNAPRGGLPRTLEPGVTYYFWADVSVPKGAPASVYTTSLNIYSRGESVASLPVELTVWPVVLPDDVEPYAIAELDHLGLFRHHVRSATSPSPSGFIDWRDLPCRSQYDALLASTLRLLQRHRLTPVLPELSPPVRVSSRGELSIDWSMYDDIVGPVLDGRAYFNRVPQRAWPIPLHAMFSSRRSDPLGDSSGSQRLLKDYLAQCAVHFADKGWLGRAYALAPAARPGNTGDVETVRRFATLVSSADRRIAVATRLFPQDMNGYGWIGYPDSRLTDEADILIPPAQFYDPQSMASQRAAGRRTWLGVDRPPFSGTISIHAPPSYTDVLSWQCKASGAEALWLGCVNHWPDGAEAGNPEDCMRFDPNALLLPGAPFGLDEPVQTLRLKRVRESLQAAAYADLLERHGLNSVTKAIRGALVNYVGTDAYRTHFADGRAVGWPDRHEAFELARQLMADAIADSSSTGKAIPRSETVSREIKWQRFHSLTDDVQLRADGVRLRILGPPKALSAEIESWFTVTNRSRFPLETPPTLVDLADHWEAVPEGAHSGAVAATATQRFSLVCRRDGFSLTERRLETIVAEMPRPNGHPIREVVRVASLTAEPVAPPPVIDGHLTDWPPGAINLASDFQLISGGCADAESFEPGAERGKACGRPKRRTLGFVMRDEHFLYVAINSEAGPESPSSVSRRKSVRYEDLIPLDDEDLTELLIDPLNGGSRSPGDLFHIVVKRSGIYLVERGIEFDPPCGSRATWSADIDVATRSEPNRWTSELRIPLAAFGHPSVHGEVWGFNITRWDAAEQQFSNWSNAIGNAYDPLSLGNLILP